MTLSLSSSVFPCFCVSPFFLLVSLESVVDLESHKQSKSVKGSQLNVSRVLRCFKNNSKKFQGCFKEVPRVFQGCFKEISRGVSTKSQGCFMEVSRKFQESFKEH